MKLHLPLAFALGLTASTAFAQDPAYDANTVLAEVNGKEITLGHVVAMRMRLPEQYQNLPDQVLYDGILDQLIDQTVLADHVKAQEGYDSRAVELVVENESRGILASSLIEKLNAEPLPEGALEKLYEDQIAKAPAELEMNAAHILVETEEEAKALIAQLEGGADFAELAKEKSTGPSGPTGGALGWFGKGQMVPAFEEAASALEVGGVSAPVKTQFGWHVIKLNETREKPKPSLAAVSEPLTQRLTEELLQAKLKPIRDAASITRAEVAIPPEAIKEVGLIGR